MWGASVVAVGNTKPAQVPAGDVLARPPKPDADFTQQAARRAMERRMVPVEYKLAAWRLRLPAGCRGGDSLPAGRRDDRRVVDTLAAGT